MKSRVLFVDDEIKVLQGLRRMLRGMRNEWVMAFAESGEKALQLLEKAPADVVVTDMQMPGMDGAQLLNAVRKRHPGAARIILSGYANEESVLRTIGPAHQYLAKPCSSETLTKTVTSALELRGLLGSEKLRHLVSSLDTLPTPPEVYFNLLDELNSPTASVISVSKIVSRDVAMTAQILKLTNSAFFALPTTVTSSQQAVRLLGFDTIRALVLMAGFFSRFKGDASVAAFLERLSRRSLAIGVLAKAIAEAEKLNSLVTDQACCAGALSHVGTLLLIANWPDRFKKASSLAETDGLGIVEAVAYHHQPSSCSYHKFGALTVLHVAQYLTKGEADSPDSDEMPGAALDQEYLAEVGVTNRLPAWRKISDDIKTKDLDE